MHLKDCPRSLDRPITFFGLEVEDLSAVLAAACGVMVLLSPLLSVPVGFALFFALRKVKEGKPPGYRYYLLYRAGLVRLFPRALKGPHLLPPPPLQFAPGAPRVQRLSPVVGDPDPTSFTLASTYLGSNHPAEVADAE